MQNKLINTLTWGCAMYSSSYIFFYIFKYDKNSLRNIAFGSFVLGCIRGYTGKNIIALLLTK
jgi:hypothetical protein